MELMKRREMIGTLVYGRTSKENSLRCDDDDDDENNRSLGKQMTLLSFLIGAESAFFYDGLGL